MGHNTDGILAFGFELKQEVFEEDWMDEPEWQDATPDDFIPSEYKEKHPYDDWDDYLFYKMTGKSIYEYELYEDIRKKKDEIDFDAYKECIVRHCSTDYPLYIVSAKTHISHRGRPIIINEKSMDVTNQDLIRLRNFCMYMNIPYFPPKWLLASYKE